MPGDPDRHTREAVADLAGVVGGLLLRRDDGGVADAAVLFPADERVVRAAVGNHDAARGQAEGHGGELHPLRLVVDGFIMRNRDAGKTRRLRRLLQRFQTADQRGARGHHRLFYDGGSAFQIKPVRHGGIVQIGKNGEGQRVHLVQRVGGKGQIAAPAQIGKQIFIGSFHVGSLRGSGCFHYTIVPHAPQEKTILPRSGRIFAFFRKNRRSKLKFARNCAIV